MTALEIATIITGILLKTGLIGMIVIGLGFLATPILYLFQRLKSGGFHTDHRTDFPSDFEFPAVLIQLPVFNEPAVVAGLLKSVSELDWPKNKLHIQLLDDSTDGTSEIAAEHISRQKNNGFNIDHVRRDNRAGFKAGALAEGLALSDEPFVALLDSDFRPPREWLRTSLPLLANDARASFIQSRCEFSNADTNLLTRAQALLFDAHFVMEQAPRACAGLFFQFNGTGGIWRRAAIESAGGWTPGSLSEDLELALRAELAGWHGLFSMEPAVRGLVPDKITDWGKQQRRWAMGFAQTARKLVWPIWKSGWPFWKRVSAEFLILYQVFLPLVALVIFAFAADIVLSGWNYRALLPYAGLISALIVIVGIGMTLPPYLALRRGNIGHYLAALAALPFLFLFLGVTNGGSIVGAFFGRAKMFERTPKGHQSRSIA